jgi:hydrogenase expression/formation protein HypE
MSERVAPPASGEHDRPMAEADANRPRLACAAPRDDRSRVMLAHGGGGRMSQRLVREMFLAAFDNPALARLHDGATLAVESGVLAVTTDSFVITPRFFPGGDIGSLAVHGTINDLAMCGAVPIALTCGFVLEEGLELEELRRIVASMARAAGDAGVPIVTGDTKVVDRGKGDGVFIGTTGLGRVLPGIEIGPPRARPGDVVLVSGGIAQHGVAILSVRQGLAFETTLTSDAASLHGLIADLLAAAGASVHVLRDPTRGGVASSLNEIAAVARVGITLAEGAIPVAEEVRGACELLGLDPLEVANEGKALAIVAPDVADAALAAWRAHPLGREAAAIGRVTHEHPGRVVLATRIGGTRVVDVPNGEPLPRIC